MRAEHRPDRQELRAEVIGPARAEASDAIASLLEVVLSDRSLEAHLVQIAGMAADLHPAITGCGVAVRRGGRIRTVAASHPLAAEVDEVQFAAHEGPSLDAFATGHVVGVDDHATDRRWPRYGRHAVAHAVRSSLSVPLQAAGSTIAVLNAYAGRPDVFTGAVRDAVLRFAGQAEGLVAVTLRSTEQSDELGQIQTAMDARSVIDQALGVLMAQQRCSADEAFALLRTASQSRNRKMSDLAVDIVTSVSGGPPRTGRFSS